MTNENANVITTNFKDQIVSTQRSIALLAIDEFIACIERAVNTFVTVLCRGLPMLVCGNGDSAVDTQHIAVVLVGQFLKSRRASNVHSLSTYKSLINAWGNYIGYGTVFSRQVEVYGAPGGVLLVISTNGNSQNVPEAARFERSFGMSVICLSGESGGKLCDLYDVILSVPATSTPSIQEVHVMVYHYMCEAIEDQAGDCVKE